MALSGVHVTCAFAGVDGFEDLKPALIKSPAWSEGPASGTPTTNVVPNSGTNGSAILRIDMTHLEAAMAPQPEARQLSGKLIVEINQAVLLSATRQYRAASWPAKR